MTSGRKRGGTRNEGRRCQSLLACMTRGKQRGIAAEWPLLQRTERLFPCNMHSVRCSKHVRSLRACECCTAIWRGGRGGSPLFLCVHFAPPQLSQLPAVLWRLSLLVKEANRDQQRFPTNSLQHALSNAPLASKLWLDSRQLKRSKVAPFCLAASVSRRDYAPQRGHRMAFLPCCCWWLRSAPAFTGCSLSAPLWRCYWPGQ